MTPNFVWSVLQAKRHFRPELLNLLDEIVLFDPLSRDQLREVARLQIKDLAVPLAERGVALAVTDAALNLIVSMNYDPVSGAGPMCRWIEKRVLSQMQDIDQNSMVYIDATNKGELCSFAMLVASQDDPAFLQLRIWFPWDRPTVSASQLRVPHRWPWPCRRATGRAAAGARSPIR